MLKPGGQAHIMIYNSYSYRRWMTATGETFKYLLNDKFGFNSKMDIQDKDRVAYDESSDGEGAPYTDFYSKGQITKMTKNWSSRKMRYGNVNDSGRFVELCLKVVYGVVD